MTLTIREASPGELHRLTALFDYNDVADMIAQQSRRIASGEHSIFLLLDGDDLIGEIHVTWRSADPLFAISGHRAYLSAFRIRADKQGYGYGTFLLGSVLRRIHQGMYQEVVIGVEDDNPRARHMYIKQGFTEHIARCRESYQGDEYEFDLLLKRFDPQEGAT